MNSSSSRELEFAKERASDGSKIMSKPTFTTSSWSRLKDPRIIRVSRAFGGKDRHSKVCTVKGLKDRRVRLSVSTAIQLYDLQDRLGLNQPSKVIDWLLNAAKDEIDELPPLKMPFGNFGQATLSASSQLGKIEGGKTNDSTINWEDFWNPNRSKEAVRESREIQKANDQEDGNTHDHHGTFVQPSTFFAKRNHSYSSLPCLLNSNGSFLKWDPSNLSLSQFGSYGSITPSHQQEDMIHNFNMSSTTLPSIPSASQLLAYAPPPQTQFYFPCHEHSGEFGQKQVNFQMMSSSSSSQNPLSSSSNFTPSLFTINQGMRPFHLSMNPKLFSCQLDHNHGDEPSKGN